MRNWIWILALVVMAVISGVKWPGLFLFIIPAILLFPPLWSRLALNGYNTRESGRVGWATVLTVLVAFVTWAGINNQVATAEHEALIASTDALIEAAQVESPVKDHSFRWEYSETADPMTDKKIKTACLKSSNAVMLPPPYEPTRARLCVRNHPKHGNDAFVALEKSGQVMCRPYQDCTVQVRFDKNSQQAFSAIGSGDGSTNIFFIHNVAKMKAGLRKADVTAVQAEFYQAGNQIMLFDTKGFNWE